MTVKLTERQQQVLKVLDRYGLQQPGVIAARAFIRTSSPRETAAKHCINLVKLGFARKRGTRMYPEWEITQAGRDVLSPEAPASSKEEGE